jgi:signal transduction histidine kinase
MISPVQCDLEKENVALREELSRAQAELRRVDQLKRDFIALSAHELRAPLAVLLGYAKILEGEAVGATRERAQVIVAQAWRLKDLVDAILILQQVDAGEVTLHMEPIGIRQVLEEAVDEHRNEIGDKALDIQLHAAGELLVYADRERLALVLNHLLSNSIKFSPTKGRIAISARADITCVLTSIHDEGLGIPDEEQPHIFDRFYQVGDVLTRHHNGLGLGLAVAKAIVELHHGRIWVESTRQEGSTFHFSLPRIIGSPGSHST